MNLADFWNPDTNKSQTVKELPTRPARNPYCRRCRKPDARACFVDRQPTLAKAALFAHRECDCECHSH